MKDFIYEYIHHGYFFAQTANYLEDMTSLEFAELGASEVKPIYRGLSFKADKESLYRILYQTRLASRIIAPLKSFDCHSDKYLYSQTGNIDWSEIFSNEDSFAINANVSDSKIKHSIYAAQVMKDAIVDQFRKKTGERPNYDQKDPDLRLSLHIHKNHASIGLDLSLTSLHKRGYRLRGVMAPLQETLGAAIIRFSKWDGETPLVDPFCGSGTLLSEGLMHYCRIPAGYLRKKWGLRYLPDYDAKIFDKVVSTAKAGIRPLPEGLISGSDISSDAVFVCRDNLACLPGGEKIKIEIMDFKKHSPIENSTIVTNLPYGVRLGDNAQAKQLYNQLGDYLKNKCKGTTAYIMVGDKNLTKELRLRATRTRRFKNGDLETQLAKLSMY